MSTATTTKLAPLRSRLGELRRKRASVRIATGFAGFAAAGLAALFLAFLVDVALEMGRLERLISLGLLATAGWFVWRRLLKPYLGQRESDLDMALLVEGRMKIDSDLVAALQFEDPEARRWGSGQLRDAVIDYVAEFGNSVDVFQGLSKDDLKRKLIAVGVAAAVWVALVVTVPRHVPVFFQRLFLASTHYPTATTISEIRINSDLIKPGVARMRHGRPLDFQITTTGATPNSAEVRLRPRLRRDAGLTAWVLDGLSDWAFAGSAPVVDTAASAIALKPGAKAPRVFTGQSAPLTEPLEFQIFAGDAWTDPQAIDIVPLPAVQLAFQTTPPDYARHVKLPPATAGSQVLSVVEGSRVDVELSCSNKGLRKATLTAGKVSYPLERTDDSRHVWRLKTAGTPFERVSAPIAFSVQVEDLDELSLERPLLGHIRLMTDREPRVVAASVTERVLPTARPTIGYKATDDFGIAEVRLKREVERADGRMEPASDVVVVSVAPHEQPVTLLPRETEGLRAELALLKLEKGDRVRVTVVVTDYRGSLPGKTASSEPLVFQVTDQSGILEGLTEADQKSARQLDVIIQRQLGIGDSR